MHRMQQQTDLFGHALKVYRRVLVSTAIFSFFISLLMFVQPLYMLQVYDRVLNSRNELTLIGLTVVAIAMLLVYAALEFVRSRVLVRAGMQFDEALSDPLFRKVVNSTLQAPQTRSQFALQDIDRLREFLTGGGMISIFDVPWVPVFLAVCWIFHPLIFAVAFVGSIIVFTLAVLNEFSTRKSLNDAQSSAQSAQHFATTTLQNVEVIQALGMERPLRERWFGMHSNTVVLQALASDRAGVLLSLSKFVRMSMQIAILGVGAYLALNREISPGMMVASSIMMGRALAPVDQVVGQWKQVSGARQAYARLKDLFSRVQDGIERLELPKPKGQLQIENLVVGPPGTRTPIINGVTFFVDPGQTLAIVGASGAGKSTLIRALVGVWAPMAGAVRLDGSELDHWDVEQLGASIGYLPQDIELFAGTIAENIARFQLAEAHEIVSAAQLAGVHTMIQGLPEGYETQIGAGGRALSGGQRQRIGLARALFRDPAVVVLDEPNAHLDSDGENSLMAAVAELKKRGCTVIFVSHKVNLLSLSDQALVLENGRVRVFGPTREVFRPQAAPIPDRPKEVPSEGQPSQPQIAQNGAGRQA
jgi:ATP-binding cassette subfamily C protein/ATP-binding cassette subfamily C protein EexD